MLPLVGISTYREQAAWGVWDELADVLPAAYARSVERAGGVPVLLPPTRPEGAAAVVGGIHALVIGGGADVDPGRYGETPHASTAGWREDRDAWELALLEAANRARLPILGICRGMQLMAVHGGGALEQHVPDRTGGNEHSPGGAAYGSTTVTTVPGTVLASAIGPVASVGCHHHQAVREHPGFDPAAWAEDGTLEAMEDPGHHFRVAVQWHPETRRDAGLFRGLVDAAAQVRRGRPRP